MINLIITIENATTELVDEIHRKMVEDNRLDRREQVPEIVGTVLDIQTKLIAIRKWLEGIDVCR